MGTINKAANMYRQNKRREYVQAETAGHYAKENEVKLADGTIGHVDLSHGEYHPGARTTRPTTSARLQSAGTYVYTLDDEKDYV